MPAKDRFPANEMTLLARPHSVPVLKGLAANPVLQVIASVPAGGPAQALKALQCSLNDYRQVEKIDVYLTGAEPFSTSNLLASYKPAANNFNIPVALTIQPGLKFIWFSIVLKSEAAINRTIELRCKKMIDGAGKPLPVKEEAGNYKRHTGSVVRKAGDDQVNTYRIPGIVQTDKGTLIAVYDIRYTNSRDLPGYIDIGMSRSEDSGRSWQPMKMIMTMGGANDNSGVGDPTILFDATTKTIWVAGLWSKGNHSIAGSIGGLSPDSTGQFLLVSSKDDGHTWSQPENITPQIKVPEWKILFQGPGAGIVTQDGKLVFPAQYWDAANIPHSTIIFSEDQGRSWTGKITGPKANTTESQVIETEPGTLMLNMRDNRGTFRSVSTTTDLGKTWTEHSSSYNSLPDPVCMGSLLKTRVNLKGVTKEVLFFSNPATTSGRYNITIKASLDMGKTWLPAHELLLDARESYGYSCLTRIDDNTIGILYEGIKDLYFVSIPVKDVLK